MINNGDRNRKREEEGMERERVCDKEGGRGKKGTKEEKKETEKGREKKQRKGENL